MSIPHLRQRRSTGTNALRFDSYCHYCWRCGCMKWNPSWCKTSFEDNFKATAVCGSTAHMCGQSEMSRNNCEGPWSLEQWQSVQEQCHLTGRSACERYRCLHHSCWSAIQVCFSKESGQIVKDSDVVWCRLFWSGVMMLLISKSARCSSIPMPLLEFVLRIYIEILVWTV